MYVFSPQSILSTQISFSPCFSERTFDAQSAAQRQRLHVRRLCDAGGVRARMDLRTVAHAADTCHHLRGRRGLHEAGAGRIVDTVHSTGAFNPVFFFPILDFLRFTSPLTFSTFSYPKSRAYLIVLAATNGNNFECWKVSSSWHLDTGRCQGGLCHYLSSCLTVWSAAVLQCFRDHWSAVDSWIQKLLQIHSSSSSRHLCLQKQAVSLQ